MIDIASKHIIPAVIKYITSLAKSINEVRQACARAVISVQERTAYMIIGTSCRDEEGIKGVRDRYRRGREEEEGMEQACYFEHHVVPAMENLRRPVDQLEMIVDKNVWPMPSYGDLLFEV